MDLETNVFAFRDDLPTSDIVQEYHENIKCDATPLIIDNGSYQCRAGWVTDDKPRLIFKNLVARSRSKNVSETHCGNEVNDVEVQRWQLRSQFDRNVVTHAEVQEQLFDHLFSHLGIQESAVNHDVVITEAPHNLNHSRQIVHELLFECYGVPRVAVGVDCLFSWAKTCPGVRDALIISFGFHTIHVVPILDGKVAMEKCYRINLGGFLVTALMHRILQLKYMTVVGSLHWTRSEELVHSHCYVADNIDEEMEAWRSSTHLHQHAHRMKVPIPGNSKPACPTMSAAERRQQQSKRMKEMMMKRQEKKLANDEQRLEELQKLEKKLRKGDGSEEEMLSCENFASRSDLKKEIENLIGVVTKIRERLKSRASSPSSEEKKETKQDEVDEKGAEFQEWIQSLRDKRKGLLESMEKRRQKRAESGKRRTAASQKRMRIITQLAEQEKPKVAKKDTFGMKDEDWNVYKEISLEADSDSEEESSKVQEIENVLMEHGVGVAQDCAAVGAAGADGSNRSSEILVGVERFRVPELLFQPAMIGTEQAGVVETIELVLSKFTNAEQERLVQCVYLTGGNASFPNLKERMEKELLAIRPFQSSFQLFVAESPSLDAWHGAKEWARDGENVQTKGVSWQEYDEKGGEYLKEHACSNVFTPTPTAIVNQAKKVKSPK